MAGITFTNWDEGYRPRWAGDYYTRQSLLAGGVILAGTSFPITGQVIVTVASGGAAQGAVSVPVAALSGAIPNGTLMSFNSAEFIKLTAAATAGATSLTVEALPTALEENDTFTYTAGATRRYVPAGTLVGRTFAERDSGTAFGPWAASDDEVYLTAYDIYDATAFAEVALYRPGSLVHENFLPDWANWTSGMKAALRGAFTTTKAED